MLPAIWSQAAIRLGGIIHMSAMGSTAKRIVLKL